MNLFFINGFIALGFIGVQGRFTLSGLLVGFGLGYLALWLTRPLYGETRYFQRVPKTARLICYFLVELVRSNLRVLWDVVTPGHISRPGHRRHSLERENRSGDPAGGQSDLAHPGNPQHRPCRRPPHPVTCMSCSWTTRTVFGKGIKNGLERLDIGGHPMIIDGQTIALQAASQLALVAVDRQCRDSPSSAWFAGRRRPTASRRWT
jgi:hypothetical protein